MLVFNNGGGRKPVEYSSVDEIVPPTDENGNYIRLKRGQFGPAKPLWSYTAPNKKDFYSWFISGAQRLPNGNTLINAGAVGIVFEVTPEGETVWKLSNPFKNAVPGQPMEIPAAPKRFEAVARARRDALNMTPDQRKKLDEIDNELIAKLDKVLTVEQIKSFAEPNPSDLADLSKRPPGQYLTVFNRSTRNVTDEQRKELQALQKEFSQKIATILTNAQKNMVADFKKGQTNSAAGRGASPKAGNTLFRATRFALDYPAFVGKTFMPGKTLVQIEEEFDKEKSKADAAAKVKMAAARK